MFKLTVDNSKQTGVLSTPITYTPLFILPETELEQIQSHVGREEVKSPVHTMESLANRSDKQTEVVIYVLTGTFILCFAPYVSMGIVPVDFRCANVGAQGSNCFVLCTIRIFS